ncbi:MAG: prepilin-type N-terminal cleavage/methylation domain-containing protein [Candidatus Parcubacteria bacterium]|nr:prepilin-type N-terminal cleavage/methylation domain-containing protein [Candidatus Parcubacteria bacterium]
MKNKIKKSGFTLIELLVVIAIIGILSSVVLASLNSARMKARDARRIADLKQIQLALELFYDSNGYYPQSNCGWDCNQYRYSYDSSWDALATDLKPYISALPKDPLNSSCAPWNNNCYSYTYGNVGRSTYPAQYDLTAQLEDTSNSQRCGVKNWKYYFDNEPWCPQYSNQIYEASLK